MNLLLKIKKNISDSQIIKAGETILIGVSGGPDSMFLLYALNHLRRDLGFAIQAAHINHNLRRDSSADEELVKRTCKQLNVPCHIKKLKKGLQKRTGSLEDHAREARLGYFIQTAEKIHASKIALAHTNDDLAETVLMRILRGSGLQGMRAILPVKVLKGKTFIRPLLAITKKESIAFLQTNNIPYRTDSTNSSTIFFRNKIRHKLIPLLKKEYNQNIAGLLSNISETLSADFDFMTAHAESAYQKLAKTDGQRTVIFQLKGFLKEHIALQRLLIRMAIEKLQGSTNQLNRKHLVEIDSLIHSRPDKAIVHLPNAVSIQKNQNRLFISRSKQI